MNMKKINWGFWCLGFFIPVAGCVLYGIWQKSQKEKAVSAGYGTLFGLVFYFIFAIVAILFF